IDACRSDRPAGTIIRATWPDPSLEERAGYNSHSFGIAAVLQLAATLGRLPADVCLFAVAGQHWEPGQGMSCAVAAALPDLCRMVREQMALSSQSCMKFPWLKA